MRRRFVLASLGVGAASPVLATPPPPPQRHTISIFFDQGSTWINTELHKFKGIAHATKYPYSGPIRIVGHTSKDEEEGMALSLARAQGTRDRLIEFGVRPQQFESVEGVADQQPLDPKDDGLNRRVVISLEQPCTGAC